MSLAGEVASIPDLSGYRTCAGTVILLSGMWRAPLELFRGRPRRRGELRLDPAPGELNSTRDSLAGYSVMR